MDCILSRKNCSFRVRRSFDRSGSTARFAAAAATKYSFSVMIVFFQASKIAFQYFAIGSAAGP